VSDFNMAIPPVIEFILRRLGSAKTGSAKSQHER